MRNTFSYPPMKADQGMVNTELNKLNQTQKNKTEVI
jgi:hypothetical protein